VPILSGMVKRKGGSGAKVAVGYCRVSTSGQAVEGVSLDAQREALTSWAGTHGYRLLNVHTDAGRSGKRADNRPALQAAIKEACSAGAVLVSYSLSRIARSVPDAYEIAGKMDKCGAGLALLKEQVDTGTAAGRMFFGMLAVLAAFERELTSERTATAMDHKRKGGHRISGQAPFGHRFEDGKVVPDAKEAASLATIRALRSDGLSLRAIVDRLNADGVPARGTRWHLRSVQLALQAV
jgi:site-specific DNA recombinase